MTALDAATVARVRAEHPSVFARPARERLKAPLVVLGILLYAVFCIVFFRAHEVLGEARWERAGAYLADWVSYEIAPEIRNEGEVEIRWPRFSALGPDPDPDWADQRGDAADLHLRARSLADHSRRLRRGPARRRESVTLLTGGRDPVLAADAPGWAVQDRTKVLLQFGPGIRAEVRDDKVKLRRRFWGWENFVFDPSSPFWQRPAGEVVRLIVAGPRIDPDRSNLALAFEDFWYNAEWQHGDVYIKLLQTIVMAFVGTLFAAVLAFPLSFLAARNITPNRALNWGLKRLFDFVRCVDMLIWALFFTRGFGPGPLAGIGAIFLTDTGTFGKLYSEALENIDDGPREGLRSLGAPRATVQRFAVVPQVLPVFISQTLYFWESNTRSATIIGAVGAGGIGLKLWEAMRTNADWENVAYMVLLILLVVFAFDNVSNALAPTADRSLDSRSPLIETLSRTSNRSATSSLTRT